MAILVDTSAWIDLFRGLGTPPVKKLKSLLGQDELLIGDLILAELLQGVRTNREAYRIEQTFRAYRVVPLVGESIARRSAENYRSLRRKGITVRKTIDCLIATTVIGSMQKREWLFRPNLAIDGDQDTGHGRYADRARQHRR